MKLNFHKINSLFSSIHRLIIIGSAQQHRAQVKQKVLYAFFSYKFKLCKAVFEDFTGRRAGLLKALTCDIDELLRQCDPNDDKKTNLCFFGFPDKTWEAMEPSRNVPPKLPEPFLEINHTSHLMARSREHWLLFVASHSDAWLLSTAFFAASTLDSEQKASLFDLINELPTLYQVLSSNISASNVVRTPMKPEVNHESSCLGAAAAQDPMKKLPEEEEEEEE